MNTNEILLSHFTTNIDWILRIVGMFTILKTFVSFFYNLFKTNYSYDEINIISNPDKNMLNQFRYYETFEFQNDSNIDPTLFAPVNKSLHKLSLYKLKLTKRGQLKKTERIYYKKKLEPNEAILFHIYRNCASPSVVLSWKSKDGYTSDYYFSENGFNGNNDLQIIKYKKNFINSLIDFILKK